MTTEPQSAKERLLAMEAYNSRSFALITEEAITAIEAEAVARRNADIAEAIRTLPAVKHRSLFPGHFIVSEDAVLAIVGGRGVNDETLSGKEGCPVPADLRGLYEPGDVDRGWGDCAEAVAAEQARIAAAVRALHEQEQRTDDLTIVLEAYAAVLAIVEGEGC